MTPRLDPRRWSLQLRLTAYIFAAVTAILCVVGWVLYDQLTHQLWEKDEEHVRSTMEVERAIVQAMDTERGPDLWQREWREHAQRKSLSLRLTAPDGKVMDTLVRLDIPAQAFPAARPRKTALARFVADGPEGKRRYMLATRSVETKPGSVWLLQAAYDATESNELIETFGRRLVLVVAAAVLAASALAAWLVQRGLRPLRVMSEAISGITAHRLDARLAQQAWPSDLRQLADSFDQMLERLQAAFDQLSRFSSDLAHEFRSPITNLVSAAGVMLSRERSPAEYQDTLAVVVEEGDRLSRMVSSMLFLARADHAKQALNVEAISIAEHLQQISDAFGAVADERGVRLEIEGEGVLCADPMLLRNALSNLVSNALQHTPAGGSVTLSAGACEGGIELSVVDSGTGIGAEHLPHLFERFYRVDAARSAGDRTGLGLAVVHSIAELHSGKVTVHSVPGSGSRFTLWLPVVSVGTADAAPLP